MIEKTILIWFRNDLRIHDNEILLEAIKKSDKILPVYCFDPRYFSESLYGTLKTGALRAKFLIESVTALKNSLKSIGGDLLVTIGKPEDLLPEIAKKYAVTEVYHHREVATEETEISSLVEAALWKQQINLKHFIGHTLYHKEDLPFPIKDIPDVFAVFKKKVERDSTVRPCFHTPVSIVVPESLELGTIPTLADFGLEEPLFDERSVAHFKGGEEEGLKRMHDYFREMQVLDLKSLRTADVTSKLSPWLSLGCLSNREVYWNAKKYIGSGKDAVNLLITELLWRDYFRFMFKKHHNKFISEAGLNENPDVNEQALFNAWRVGQTGIPYIDANMRELNETAYISYRGRQAVANFLVKDLGVNWALGAAYFEEKLLDYSPASNWGNWAHIALGGKDAKDSKHLTVLSHAPQYDPKGDYIRKWIPELSEISGKQIYQPWKVVTFNIKDYPKPMVELL